MGRMTYAAIAAMATAGTMAIAAPATAQQTYSKLFVFGDSLVDSGNAQALRALAGGADPAPASSGYANGRFSNGANFADYLSTAIGFGGSTASERGGSNFSIGGAQAAEISGDASDSFLEQIGNFDDSGQRIAGDALVLVTFGGNDVRRELGFVGTIPGYVPNLTVTVDAMTAGLTALYDRGARNFVVTGLPDIGQIPAVTSLGSSALNAAGTRLSTGLNAAFSTLVGGFDATPGVDAVFFDLLGYQKTIYANPTAFGLPSTIDTRTACLTVPGAAPACDNFVYFDPIHPTTGVHAAIANGIATRLGTAAVPEPASWAMMLVGFALTGMAIRYRRRRIAIRFA